MDSSQHARFTNQQLLAEIDDILREMPTRATIRQETEENYAWLGRVSALIENWNPPMSVLLRIYLDQFYGRMAHEVEESLRKIVTLLYQARHDLRMKTVGPVNVLIGEGMVFDYFDEIRKIADAAKEDVLFIDPYIDAGFVSRYLTHVAPGVRIRLLVRERLDSLLPAVDAFVEQSKAQIEVRSSADFNDRYVIVDKVACYQSGASFRDGPKAAPTTLTQITDAFPAVLETYETLWTSANPER
jgi:hypothetical protein